MEAVRQSAKPAIRPEIYDLCANWVFIYGLAILQLKLAFAPDIKYSWIAACLGVAFVLKNEANG